jgi:hypothetical protein
VVDKKLAAALEQFAERFLADRCVEDIVLLDFDPGKSATLGQPARRVRA